MTETAAHHRSPAARRVWRNVGVLAFCQGLFMTGASMVMTVSALAGLAIAADPMLATLPLGLQFTATMFTTLPASFVMKHLGRRAGFQIGAVLGALGAALSAHAILSGDFLLFCAGAVLIGIFNGFSQYYRFAAADSAPEALRSRAISWVLAGGVVAAFAGPNLANFSRELLAPAQYAGAYASLVGLQIGAVLLLLFVQIPRLTEAQQHDPGRPIGEIMRQPAFVVALLGGMVGYASMTLIMTATPLAMHAHGHTFGDTTFVIEWHVFGMFAPSFFTGYLIRRFGVLTVMLAGAVFTLACALINLSGNAIAQFWAALLLLGVGWNFLYVGASTLITETYRPAEAAKTQGVNEFVVFGAVATAALTSGALQSQFGWQAVNAGVIPFVTLVTVLLVWLMWRRARR